MAGPQNLLGNIGIHASYINVLLMVDNFLPAFDMSEQIQIDKKVDEHIRKIQEDIKNGRQYIAPVTEKDRAAHQEYLARREKMPQGTFTNLYRITENCIGCEICARICPKKCFTVEYQKSTWHSEGCITCMACIHACPMMAIQLNLPEKNSKARYRNEHISICEIVDANNQF